VSFAALTLSVASQRVFIVAVLFRYQLRKLLDSPTFCTLNVSTWGI
jgi:hypothetical protein